MIEGDSAGSLLKCLLSPTITRYWPRWKPPRKSRACRWVSCTEACWGGGPGGRGRTGSRSPAGWRSTTGSHTNIRLGNLKEKSWKCSKSYGQGPGFYILSKQNINTPDMFPKVKFHLSGLTLTSGEIWLPLLLISHVVRAFWLAKLLLE